jgi:hypothetical protein
MSGSVGEDRSSITLSDEEGLLVDPVGFDAFARQGISASMPWGPADPNGTETGKAYSE